MRIAVVDAGVLGLAAARQLAQDERHEVVVLESEPQSGDRASWTQVARSVNELHSRGVTMRAGVHIDRIQADRDGVDVVVNGCSERFDLVVTAFTIRDGCVCFTLELDPREPILEACDSHIYACKQFTTVIEPLERRCVCLAALAQPADDIVAMVSRQLGLRYPPLRVRSRDHLAIGSPRRIYSADDALAQMAADHPDLILPARPDRGGKRALWRARTELVDLSDSEWPLSEPAVYVANRRSAFKAPGAPPVREESTTTVDTAVAALTALDGNVPIVPIAAYRATRLRLRPQVVIVIGEPFYPETSDVGELMDDIRNVLAYLEDTGRRAGSRPRGRTSMMTMIAKP